jgi:toxin-antitoxin system, antitoxin component, xre family
MNIGKIIKKRRKELNLSLKDIAKKLNVSESSISRYENEEIKSMRIDKLIPLSEILQVDIRELLLENYDKNYFHLSEEEKELILNLRKEKENNEKLFKESCEKYPELITELEDVLMNINKTIENDKNKKEEFYYNYDKQLFEKLIQLFQEEC